MSKTRGGVETYHSSVIWVFRLGLTGDVVETSNGMSWIRTTETSRRRSSETSLGVSFKTYLGRHWDVQRDVVTTSPRRIVAGRDLSNEKIFCFKNKFVNLSETKKFSTESS